MKSNHQKRGRNWKSGGTLLALGLLAGHRVLGSPVLMEPPAASTTTLFGQDEAIADVMNVFIPAGWNVGIPEQLLQYGPITLHPHVSYNLSYAIGVQSSTNSTQNTVVQQFSPGLTANIGRHLTLDYTAGITFYSASQLHNAVSHSAALNWNTSYEDWILGATQGFNYSDSPRTETAAQTSQQLYSTSLSAGYAINTKMSINASVGQNITAVTGLQNSYNWSTAETLNYEFWPRLKAGLGVGAGYTKVSDSYSTGVNNPDIINENIQASVSWRATDKISLSLSAGVGDQQFTAPGYSDSLNPLFSAGVQYQPFTVTQISLSASRSTGSSDYFLAAQSTENTSVNLNLTQRLLGKYSLNLGVGYNLTDFISSDSTAGTTSSIQRSDEGYVFNAGIGRNIFSHANWSVNYQYNDNRSSLGGYSQQSSEIGVQVGIAY